MIPPGAAHLARVRQRLAVGAPLDLTRAAVAGGSPQALALAVALAETGVAVVLIEEDRWDVERAQDALTRAGKGSGITLHSDPAAADGAEAVIEASGRDAGLRAALLGGMARVAPGALLASLGPGDLRADLPAPIALIDQPGEGVIEILNGSDLRAEGLARRLGALPVRVERFLGAELVAALEDEAEALVFEGSTPWDIDAAAEAVGFALGPCAAQDLRGLDRAYARHRLTGHPLPVVDRMVPEGRLGRKGGVGWYRYPGGGGRVIDPLVEDLAREEAHFAGVTPRAISDSEIAARLSRALLRAAKGLVAEPGVIDLLSVLACGFPADTGGVLFAAQPLDL
ncbi:3-hydroxyacyl-CoA dehydrogenase family protein [Pararhodobacter zhoushanensis]|uniref:3-hydroxyacyl-CoA dehydrogenase family protein n=1 Tax=Pararhodobacter zhoushanensis TaxID=2479545 RepID=A0ABT3GTS7_9RHOB|nr:3-hydroxyacyl-CoA dehydrogenase family protein [Pararhodobacter zhoushanensis]MCW1930946.1 3-hydroxyacyl-CoA dehydrogenase family protein [Pararhodobacter zhoushanensis]